MTDEEKLALIKRWSEEEPLTASVNGEWEYGYEAARTFIAHTLTR
jgi:hypothetical protein